MSTLLDIRKQLVEDSGHYDLVVDTEGDDWPDSGANRLINSGCRWLDRKLKYHKSDGWLYLKTSSPTVFFKQARVIRRVWAVYDGKRYELQRIRFGDMRDRWRKVDASEYADDYPRYFAPAPPNLSWQQADPDATEQDFIDDGMVDYDQIYFGENQPWRCIVLHPQPNAEIQLQVLAQWFPQPLEEDTDINFWTVMHPDLLVRAARLQIEIDLHRNTQGQQDFEIPLLNDLRLIADDLIAEEWQGPPSRFIMRG